MIIKNIFISDKELYLDLLIKELIKMNINYVLVDNYELIFDNYIIRFYEKEEVREVALENMFQEQEESPYTLLDFAQEKNKPKMNKRMIKEQNRKYNQMLKKGRK